MGLPETEELLFPVKTAEKVKKAEAKKSHFEEKGAILNGFTKMYRFSSHLFYA